MALTTTILLQPGQIVLSATSVAGLSFDKGYTIGNVEQVSVGSYWVVGTKIMFKQVDAVRFTDTGAKYFLLDENKIYLQIP